MLYYREALRLDARLSLNRLADVNAGMAGGDAGKRRHADLNSLIERKK